MFAANFKHQSVLFTSVNIRYVKADDTEEKGRKKK